MTENPDREITAKSAGNIVRHMIEDVEQRMAAGEQVSPGPISEDGANALQKAREENKRSGKQA